MADHNKKIAKVKARVLKLLKKSKRQFYDPKTGAKITPEEYLELLLAQKLSDVNKFKDEIIRKRSRKKNERNN